MNIELRVLCESQHGTRVLRLRSFPSHLPVLRLPLVDKGSGLNDSRFSRFSRSLSANVVDNGSTRNLSQKERFLARLSATEIAFRVLAQHLQTTLVDNRSSWNDSSFWRFSGEMSANLSAEIRKSFCVFRLDFLPPCLHFSAQV